MPVKLLDYPKAFCVALAELIITMAASYPMVTFYAYFIEPGHPQSYYVDAAQWIAPWSSHILGPIVFFAFNYWMAMRSSGRNAIHFAVACIGFYVVLEISIISAMGVDISSLATLAAAFWLLIKLAGAMSGAYFGSKSSTKKGREASA